MRSGATRILLAALVLWGLVSGASAVQLSPSRDVEIQFESIEAPGTYDASLPAELTAGGSTSQIRVAGSHFAAKWAETASLALGNAYAPFAVDVTFDWPSSTLGDLVIDVNVVTGAISQSHNGTLNGSVRVLATGAVQAFSLQMQDLTASAIGPIGYLWVPPNPLDIFSSGEWVECAPAGTGWVSQPILGAPLPACARAASLLYASNFSTATSLGRAVGVLATAGTASWTELSETGSFRLIDLAPDTDGDGYRDDVDVCPFAYDPEQLDRGGFMTSVPDGAGDACQSSDANGDGIVDWSDVAALRAEQIDSSSQFSPSERAACDRRAGTGRCDDAEIVALMRALEGEAPGIGQGLAAMSPASVDQTLRERTAAASLTSGEAALLSPRIAFGLNQTQLSFWLPMPQPGTLIFEPRPGLEAVAYDREGRVVASASAAHGLTGRERGSLYLPFPSDHYNVVFTRPLPLPEEDFGELLDMVVTFDDSEAVFGPEAIPADMMLNSPLRQMPGGEELFDVPEGAPFESFSEFVQELFGYSYEEGIPASMYYAFSELVAGFCPAGLNGPLPPTGVAHDDNYCAISAFIHSMLTTFPGALATTVGTDRTQWDEVGDRIGHSCTIGTPSWTFVDMVNRSYGTTGTKAENRKRYCATVISDESPANLAAWNEDCNVKLLVFDLSGPFGHYADITAITPDPNDPTKASITLQDYDQSYNVDYSDANNGQVDFSGPGGAQSVMEGNFNGTNTIAGDDWDEPVTFTAVCECDAEWGVKLGIGGPYPWPEPQLPTSTNAGTPLNP